VSKREEFNEVEALKQNLAEIKCYWLSSERKNKRLKAEIARLNARRDKAEKILISLRKEHDNTPCPADTNLNCNICNVIAYFSTN